MVSSSQAGPIGSKVKFLELLFFVVIFTQPIYYLTKMTIVDLAIMNIENNEVHIWQLKVKDFIVDIDDFWKTLSAAEKERAERFKFAVHKERFVVIHGVLRKLLGKYLNQKPQDINFSYNDHGKPSVINDNIHFNISHSKDMALLAFTKNVAVGVDIEYKKKDIGYEKLAQRFFSDYEYAAIMQQPEANRKQAFFNCWTRKEAFIKAIGEGLSFPLKDFDVSIETTKQSLLLNLRSEKYNKADWAIFTLNVKKNYVAALAVAAKNNINILFNSMYNK